MYKDKLLFKPATKSMFGKKFIQILPDCAYLHLQREAMELSQEEVAAAAGIELYQYERLESGERLMTSTSLRIGLAVCDVLHLDPHRFVPVLPTR